MGLSVPGILRKPGTGGRGAGRAHPAARAVLFWLAATLALPAAPRLEVPRLPSPVRIDGRLDEPCYRNCRPVRNFHLAGRPSAPVPPTAAWVFWMPGRLVVAFRVVDATPAAVTARWGDRAITGEDRIEFFLWNGRPKSAYACFEINARGAVWDYRARFYRHFDPAWSPRGVQAAARRSAGGYTVEAAVPARALAPFGIHLAASACFRGGLFRADYPARSVPEPHWITWAEAGLKKPDFHVAGSFGTFCLLPAR